MKTIDYIVTGGLGFIGSYMVDLLVEKGYKVLIIDKNTYAANQDYHKYCIEHKAIEVLIGDIAEVTHLPLCSAIFNFAAESHVDNSIECSNDAAKSNFFGVHNLLERLRKRDKEDQPLFFQVSTDEVYGDITNGSFTESSQLNPSNPYAATKAGAEHIITAYGRTYEIDYVITRCTNNFGCRQYPEKLIPRAFSCIQHNIEFPVHGNGTYIRNWVHVKDHVNAIWDIYQWRISQTKKLSTSDYIFNISGNVELSNIKILEMIEQVTKSTLKKTFVKNRPGQDVRYAICCQKLKTLTDWVEKYPISINTLDEIYRNDYDQV